MRKSEPKTIAILGSTGSIGTQALDVVRNLNYRVVALTAARNIQLLEKQIREFLPMVAVVNDVKLAADLKQRVTDTATKVLCGMDGVIEAAGIGADTVLNSIVGIAGLRPTISAIYAGSDVALANKETLVTAGKLVMRTAKEKNVQIIPVDSEHSAIFQCIQSSKSQHDLRSLMLTASGGPFYGKKLNELENVTVDEAIRHPNWSMGAKISVDCATMMNKGLEIIEAVHLFNMQPCDIQVLVHRESIVHSLVEFNDSSVQGQMGVPDMRIPIQYALTYPRHIQLPVKRLNLIDVASLSFCLPDRETFVCLAACEEAIKRGGLYPAAVNGANEKAVELFLGGKIKFTDIGRIVSGVLENTFADDYNSIREIFSVDAQAREYAVNAAAAL